MKLTTYNIIFMSILHVLDIITTYIGVHSLGLVEGNSFEIIRYLVHDYFWVAVLLKLFVVGCICYTYYLWSIYSENKYVRRAWHINCMLWIGFTGYVVIRNLILCLSV